MATVSLVGGFTVSAAVRVTPPDVPEIVTDVIEPTVCVETVKLALVAPAATVTLAGTAAAPMLLLDRDTTAPPDGAAEVSVTVPVDGLPPVTVVGLSASALSEAAG